MYIRVDTSCEGRSTSVESSMTDDEAVTSIIRDALEDAKKGNDPEPKDIWADIAATLGITI